MRKVALFGLALSFLVSACTVEDASKNVKPPKLDEARMHAAVIAGRELPIFTFTGRVDPKDSEIVGVRVEYSITGDRYTSSGGSVELVSPVTLEAQYIERLHNVRLITDTAKNKDLETYLSADDSEIAFRWHIDYQPDGAEAPSTETTGVYETDKDSIDSHDLATEVRG